MKWRSENLEYAKFYQRAYMSNIRAEAYGIDERLTREDLEAVLMAQGHTCILCGDPFGEQESKRMNLDHIEPLHAGGKNHKDNVRFVCETCHDRKNSGEVAQRNRTRGHW
jgi:5-methylcytosine-specific restriction endonuclease McrA